MYYRRNIARRETLSKYLKEEDYSAKPLILLITIQDFYQETLLNNST